MGPEYILVNLSVDFVDNATTEQIEDVIDALDKKLKGRVPNVKRVFVEAESRKRSI
jgi:divalent metal cation (Fe/Co/Zn/Cd) transporter